LFLPEDLQHYALHLQLIAAALCAFLAAKHGEAFWTALLKALAHADIGSWR
jgi:hypothetical protein